MSNFSYNPGAPVGDRDWVRFLVGDTDGSVATGNPVEWSFLLTDAQIDMALARSANDPYLTAARLCLAMAASNLITARAVKLGQFQTTHDAETHWELLSERYMKQADLNALPTDEVVAWTPESWRDMLLYKALRGEQN